MILKYWSKHLSFFFFLVPVIFNKNFYALPKWLKVHKNKNERQLVLLSSNLQYLVTKPKDYRSLFKLYDLIYKLKLCGALCQLKEPIWVTNWMLGDCVFLRMKSWVWFESYFSCKFWFTSHIITKKSIWCEQNLSNIG